ncbi:hypothetical protein CMV_026373 [Castanea mollissima]|uniref:DC1 domain-containing protein n=1 Tax=Castanea mollissima TaxID=60419 RepID=A0A8J4VAG9_9ROSI|nr:hypothetical protein CMV_026373 [Castanea mollissima]
MRFYEDGKGNRRRSAMERATSHTSLPHHPLLLLDKVPANERYNCTVCLAHCSDHHHSTYGCIPCRLIIHDGSCFERKLPPQIQHFYHPHPLTLSTALSDQEDITYKACYEKFTRVWYYSCEQCKDFVMDIPCTLLLPTTIDCIKPESDQIQHFLHGHPLSLRKADDQEQIMHCRLCGKRCTGPTYVCDSGRASSLFCKKIYFHKSCLEFPQQICHPFHPYHSLTLLDDQSNYSDDRCNACRKSTTDYFLYICLYCDFIISNNKPRHFCLHVECSTMMMPAITYEGHTHLLQLWDDNIESNKLQCSACKSNICESYDFNCLYCDLNLHLSCGPLPYTVKHKDHNIHSLCLTHSPLQEEVEDETDEFYCHACEEERDPQLPVYYCAECHFVAEIQCVFSQIISSLKGKYGDLELRSSLGHSGKLICKNKAKEMAQKKEQVKATVTLYDILKSWSKGEIEQLNGVLSIAETKKDTAKKDDHDEDIISSLKGEYGDLELRSSLGHSGKLICKNKAKEIVQKKEQVKATVTLYEILKSWSKDEIEQLNGVLRIAETKKDTAKKDDHDEDSEFEFFLLFNKNYTQVMKFLDRGAKIPTPFKSVEKVTEVNFEWDPIEEVVSIGDYVIIQSMINTMIEDITKDLLLKWWTTLRILKFAEFKIQFAFDHLKRVVEAYLGLRVRKEVEDAVDKIDKDILALEKNASA